MPEFTDEELVAFEPRFVSLVDSLALAMSENLNQMVTIDAPVMSLKPIEELMNDAPQVLQATFSITPLGTDEGALAFEAQVASVFADLANGGTGTNAPKDIDDESMNRLADTLSGIIQGFGTAIGNELGEVVQPGPVATTIGTLDVPPSFAVSGTVIHAQMDFHIEGVIDSTMQMLFTPDQALALSQPDETQAAQPAPAPQATPAPQPAAAPQFAGQAAHAADPMPFQPLAASNNSAEALPPGIGLIMDIPLEVTVELGRVKMLIRDVLELSTGSIVELDRLAGEPVDILVNGRLVAKGEVVVIDDNFGIRVTEVLNQSERLASLGQRS